LSIVEKKIAICYVLHENDERNKLELTDRRLIVVRKGRMTAFANENIRSLTINQRKLLIPIIISGILTPLILVGFFKGLFHPAIAVVFIIVGFFSFYMGWMGEKVITVNMTMGYQDFHVSIVSDNITGFLNYVNQYIQDEPIHKRVLYLAIECELTDEHNQNAYLKGKSDDRKLYSYWQLKESYLSGEINASHCFIVLDPLKTGSEVKYEKQTDIQGLSPVIKGSIDKNAVIRMIRYDELGSIID
jgi:hypothetical protein